MAVAGVPAVVAASIPPDFEIKAQIQIDASFFDGVHNEQTRGSEWQVRRARIGLKHESKKDWEAEFEIDINDEDNEISITDGYVRYTGWRFGEVSFGKMKEPFGLENTTGSKDINTVERSIVTEAFKPGRNYGVLFSRSGDRSTLNLGAFQASENEDGLDGYGITARATYNPVFAESRLIHLGISASERDMQEMEYRINEPLEVNAAASIIESRRIDADNISQYALETALVYRAFSWQAEWMEQRITEITTETDGSDATYSGYYTLASYFFTGESRAYKKGTFDGVKPLSDAGAWELVLRYSSIDLAEVPGDTDDVTGPLQADTLALGINYYATGRARLMLNVAKSDVESPVAAESGEAESLTFRVQYEF